jgi:DNA-binding LacI/PurR family transcriptional regulator
LGGWRRTLEAAGAPVPPPVAGDWSAAAGYAADKRLLANQIPSAVFSANDQMTLGFLRALNDAGLRAPHDTSLIGFDDIPEAAYFNPPLTTVRQDFAEVGRRSVRLLLDQFEHARNPAAHETIAPQLVIRASAAAPQA